MYDWYDEDERDEDPDILAIVLLAISCGAVLLVLYFIAKWWIGG